LSILGRAHNINADHRGWILAWASYAMLWTEADQAHIIAMVPVYRSPNIPSTSSRQSIWRKLVNARSVKQLTPRSYRSTGRKTVRPKLELIHSQSKCLLLHQFREICPSGLLHFEPIEDVGSREELIRLGARFVGRRVTICGRTGMATQTLSLAHKSNFKRLKHTVHLIRQAMNGEVSTTCWCTARPVKSRSQARHNITILRSL